jgi:hypothetical protein
MFTTSRDVPKLILIAILACTLVQFLVPGIREWPGIVRLAIAAIAGVLSIALSFRVAKRSASVPVGVVVATTATISAALLVWLVVYFVFSLGTLDIMIP